MHPGLIRIRREFGELRPNWISVAASSSKSCDDGQRSAAVFSQFTSSWRWCGRAGCQGNSLTNLVARRVDRHERIEHCQSDRIATVFDRASSRRIGLESDGGGLCLSSRSVVAPGHRDAVGDRSHPSHRPNQACAACRIIAKDPNGGGEGFGASAKSKRSLARCDHHFGNSALLKIRSSGRI